MIKEVGDKLERAEGRGQRAGGADEKRKRGKDLGFFSTACLTT